MRVVTVISVALDLGEYIFDDLDGTFEEIPTGDDENGISHVPGEVAAVAVELFDEGEDLFLHMEQQLLGLQFLEVTPSESGWIDDEAFALLFACFSFRRFFLGFGQCQFRGANAVLREDEFPNKVVTSGLGIRQMLGVELIELLDEEQVSSATTGLFISGCQWTRHHPITYQFSNIKSLRSLG